MELAERRGTPVLACIVDDEAPGRANLRYALADYPHWQVAGECASAAEAREVLGRSRVDVLLLDIQMPGESGLSLARRLCEQDAPPLIIFVTAHDGFALDAFDLHALDYLVKPWHSQRFAQTLARAEQMLALRQRGPYRQAVLDYLDGKAQAWLDHVTVRSVGQLERIALDDVDWFSAAGNYVELHLGARSVLHRVPLAKLEARLDPAVFLRVHRAAIVRRSECAALSACGDGKYQLALRRGATVMVSERHAGAVRDCLARAL